MCAKNVRLTPAQRDFFSTVSEAAIVNPFSPERAELDSKICGLPASTPRDERIPACVEAIRSNVEKLNLTSVGLTPFSVKDRELLHYTLLFMVYNENMDAYDKLIEAQYNDPSRSLPARFVKNVHKKLIQLGYDEEPSLYYASVFYQLRRAHRFIDRALIGHSAPMMRFKQQLWDCVFTANLKWYEHHLNNRMEDFSTLILGDTGTGKGTAAKAIGRCGFILYDLEQGRFEESFMDTFVSVNLSSFSESLIESELFGHRKGAFTGAVDNYEGVLGQCTPAGSVFLDEIGEVSEPIQIKLLNVLQDRTFTPVGSRELKPFRGRVIAATNRSLDDLRGASGFRPDFYYRLCSNILTVPTLADRIADTPSELNMLVGHIVERITHQRDEAFIAEIFSRIQQGVGKEYNWPGNVRELEQAIRRIIVTGHMPQEKLGHDTRSDLFTTLEQGALTANELLIKYCKMLHARHGTYEAVARIADLDRRTARKYCVEE